MLLATFTVLFLFGLLTWLVGHYFQYLGVAAIGAAILLIAGSAIALTGLEVRTGEVQTLSYAEHNFTNNQQDDVYVNNQTTISYQYQTTSVAALMGVSVFGSLGLGGLVMLLSAVLFGQSLNRAS